MTHFFFLSINKTMMKNDMLWTMALNLKGFVSSLGLYANDLINLEQETFILFLTFWEIQMSCTW